MMDTGLVETLTILTNHYKNVMKRIGWQNEKIVGYKIRAGTSLEIAATQTLNHLILTDYTIQSIDQSSMRQQGLWTFP